MFTKTTDYHRLRIVDLDGIRALEFDGHRQSAIDMADGFTSDIRYTDYLHLALAFVPRPKRVLVIGLGGGALPKRMWRDYPSIERIDCAEIDPQVVQIARDYFRLPEDDRLCVHVVDGRTFVKTAVDTYDIVAVDAYFADAMPYELMTEEAFGEIDDRLRKGGVAAFNVIGALEGRRSRVFRTVYKTLKQVWPYVHVFGIDLALANDPRRIRNIVVLATHSAIERKSLARRISSRVGGLVSVPHFAGFALDQFTRRIRTADVPVLADATRPPDGLLRLQE